MKKTKIVATIGPASNTKERLLELVMAGVDVFRLNFSHGTHDEHLKVIKLIREINDKFNLNVGILQDLQGPKIRIYKVENDAVEIKTGDTLIIANEDIMGNAQRVGCSYEPLPRDVKIGDVILIDDGNIDLRVEKIVGNDVHATVTFGGILKSKKGMNLPFTEISMPSLTKKDREDLAFGLENNVDWIALSFVRSAADMIQLKDMIRDAGKHARVIAKIEKPEAIKNIDGIIDATDAIMIARGDLGVEVILEEVPMLQKRILEKCHKSAKPVIIATQMMESMIKNPRPTRAETSDIANSVLDGADALMLSAETASGNHPVAVVQSMVRTIKSVENQSAEIFNRYNEPETRDPDFPSKSVVATACKLAESTKAKALIGMTVSGFTAFQLASNRPKSNIFIFSDNRPILNVLNLVWGVQSFYYNRFVSTDETFKELEEFLVSNGYVQRGDLFINTASMPVNERHKTNMLKIKVAD